VPLTARENHPNEVHEEVVTPEVQKLGSRVRDLRVVVIEHAGCVVENQAVDLAHADDDLEGVAQRVRVCDEEGYDKADRAPCELSIGPSNQPLTHRKWIQLGDWIGELGETNSRNRLHAEHERVRGQVPRVGEGVFFPQLPEQVLGWAHPRVVQGEVALEKEVDCSSCAKGFELAPFSVSPSPRFQQHHQAHPRPSSPIRNDP